MQPLSGASVQRPVQWTSESVGGVDVFQRLTACGCAPQWCVLCRLWLLWLLGNLSRRLWATSEDFTACWRVTASWDGWEQQMTPSDAAWCLLYKSSCLVEEYTRPSCLQHLPVTTWREWPSYLVIDTFFKSIYSYSNKIRGIRLIHEPYREFTKRATWVLFGFPGWIVLSVMTSFCSRLLILNLKDPQVD